MIDTMSATGPRTVSGRTSLDGGNPGGVLGKDEFLKMLVAQLRHQDPLDPMDGQQMAAQMAQFSSVEQLININHEIAAQRVDQGTLLGTMQTSLAVGTIGREVVALGDQLVVGVNGADVVEVAIEGAGGLATLSILDDAGRVVGSRVIGAVGGGEQTIDIGDADDDLDPGVYRYQVTVTTGEGDTVGVRHYTRATIDGVHSTSDGLALTAGDLTIPYSAVVRVRQ